MPMSADRTLGEVRQFKIPNTVIAFWAGSWDARGKWAISWEADVKRMRDLGFSVDLHECKVNAGAPSDLGLRELLSIDTSDKSLHGIFLWFSRGTRELGKPGFQFPSLVCRHG